MSNKTQESIISILNRSKFLELFIDELLTKKKVKVTGLGIFKIVRCKERKHLNPFNSGIPILIKGYNKIKFIPTASLKEKIQ